MNKNSQTIFRLMGFMLTIGCLSQIASDIYAPSLPAIAHSLHSSISLGQWSMALYMCGIAVSLFIYGPISDAVGRKKPLVVGLSLMLMGTLICLFAPNMTILILGRLLQGCGAGACAGLWRSIFRDMFSGDEMAKYSSYLTIVVIFVIPVAPTVGGYIQQYMGWRGTFLFLTLYTLLALYTVIFRYQETSQHHHPSRLKLSFIMSTFRELFLSRIYMGYCLCVFLTYGAFFSWFTISPVLLIHVAHLTPVTYGWLNFLCSSSAMALAAFSNARLVQRLGKSYMLHLGWLLILSAGVGLLLVNACLGVNVMGIFIAIFVFYFGVTLIWPNTFSGAMGAYGHIAGYAGATYSALQLGGGGLLGAIATYLPATTSTPLAIIFIATSVLAILIFRWVVQEPAPTLATT